MKRHKRYLSDEELDLIEEHRTAKQVARERKNPLLAQNRPDCATGCGKTAAPVLGATICTWCKKRMLETGESLGYLQEIYDERKYRHVYAKKYG